MRFHLDTFPVQGKTVLIRVDYNVPLDLKDDSKIKASLETIHFLQEKRCKIILATHLGDPKGKVNAALSTKKLLPMLSKHIRHITWVSDCIGEDVRNKIATAKDVVLLENVRFYQQEESNDPAFAHSLASLAQVYVNEAFSVCHRNHASVAAITRFLPSISGFHLEKEIYYLNQALQAQSPSIWIMGGAKLDKINLLRQALKKADKILLGGALAFPFLAARGINVGMSGRDAKAVEIAAQLLKQYGHKKIILPIDFVVTSKMAPRSPTQVVDFNSIKHNQIALDIGPKTIELFQLYLAEAKTVVWNGPLGYFEWAKFSMGTKSIARFLGKVDALKVCGGGETVAAIEQFYLTHNFSHLSTGGGAALAFLAADHLPGLDALHQSYLQFKHVRL